MMRAAASLIQNWWRLLRAAQGVRVRMRLWVGG